MNENPDQHAPVCLLCGEGHDARDCPKTDEELGIIYGPIE